MNADARKDILVFLRNSDGLLEIVRMWVARPDVQHRRNARFPGTLYDFVTVVIELRTVDMAVGIDQDHLAVNLTLRSESSATFSDSSSDATIEKVIEYSRTKVA